MTLAGGGKRIANLWRREAGGLSPKRFADGVKASEDFVHSLGLHKKLQKHRGCVNTLSFNGDGSVLVSGSDDRMVILWNWNDAVAMLEFHSGHSNNILNVQFMPCTNDRSIVTCAADGEVRHTQILEGVDTVIRTLAKLESPVHKIAVEPGSSHTLYSCGEDGVVLHFDLRTNHATKLFACSPVYDYMGESTIRLYDIAIDPRNPNYFAIAGSDEYARIYDIRKFNSDGSASSGCPTDYFCPPHLIGNDIDGITGLAFSQTSELLASYSYENIYLFSRDQGLVSNNISVTPVFLLDEDDDNGLNLDLVCSASSANKAPVPRVFKGHRNRDTIKGVSFFGPNSEFVATGSDSGHVFIWRKKDGEIIRVIEGDRDTVNCIEPHASRNVIASSGIGNDIKIWAPGASEQPSLNVDEVTIHSWTSDSSETSDTDCDDDFDNDMDLDFDDENAEDEDDEDDVDAGSDQDLSDACDDDECNDHGCEDVDCA